MGLRFSRALSKLSILPRAGISDHRCRRNLDERKCRCDAFCGRLGGASRRGVVGIQLASSIFDGIMYRFQKAFLLGRVIRS